MFLDDNSRSSYECVHDVFVCFTKGVVMSVSFWEIPLLSPVCRVYYFLFSSRIPLESHRSMKSRENRKRVKCRHKQGIFGSKQVEVVKHPLDLDTRLSLLLSPSLVSSSLVPFNWSLKWRDQVKNKVRCQRFHRFFNDVYFFLWCVK